MNSAQRNPRATGTQRLAHLVRALAPVILFFFVAFLLIFLIFQLFGEQYSIEFSALSKAAVAALVLGKLIPVLDWAQSGYRFNAYRPAVVIACKTLVYGLVVILLGIGERIFHAARQTGSLQGGIDLVIAHANLDREHPAHDLRGSAGLSANPERPGAHASLPGSGRPRRLEAAPSRGGDQRQGAF